METAGANALEEIVATPHLAGRAGRDLLGRVEMVGRQCRRGHDNVSDKADCRGTVRETVLTTGTLAPTQTVNVGSQVSGLVTRLYVDWNSEVHKGQIVAEIDPRVPRAQMEQAQADLDNARANVLNNQAAMKNQESNLETAQAAVETAQAVLGTAEGGITTARAQVQQALAALDKAKAQRHVADLTLHRTSICGRRI